MIEKEALRDELRTLNNETTDEFLKALLDACIKNHKALERRKQKIRNLTETALARITDLAEDEGETGGLILTEILTSAFADKQEEVG